MFNSIKYGIKMAVAEEIAKILRHNKSKEEKEYTQEEEDRLQKMRVIKGNVPSPSPSPGHKRSRELR